MEKKRIPRWYKHFVAISLCHFVVTVASGVVLFGERFHGPDAALVPPEPSVTEHVAAVLSAILSFPILTVFGDASLLIVFLNSLFCGACIAALLHVVTRRTSQPTDGQVFSESAPGASSEKPSS